LGVKKGESFNVSIYERPKGGGGKGKKEKRLIAEGKRGKKCDVGEGKNRVFSSAVENKRMRGGRKKNH